MNPPVMPARAGMTSLHGLISRPPPCQDGGMDTETIAMPARIGPEDRRVSCDPTDPAFYQDPYKTYEAIRAVTPVFFWEELGLWCLSGYEAVNGIFRDRRFGREILHLASREEVGLAEPPEHVRAFYAVDNLSMIAREPPVHTRLARDITRFRNSVGNLNDLF